MVAAILRRTFVVPTAPVRGVARKAAARAWRFALPKLSRAEGAPSRRRRFEDMTLEETSRFAEIVLRSGIR